MRSSIWFTVVCTKVFNELAIQNYARKIRKKHNKFNSIYKQISIWAWFKNFKMLQILQTQF